MRPRGSLLRVLLLVALACSHDVPFVRGSGGAEPPPPAALDHRLLLIGDAGHPMPGGEPALIALRGEVEARPADTTVVFLGDNIYETGMPDETPLEGTVPGEILDASLQALWESRRDAERRLDAQVDAIRDTPARAIFVPGNHDWDQFGVGGWERVLAQERYLEGLDEAPRLHVSMLPGGGCPGPVSVDLGRRLVLVILDTQWWLDAGIPAKPSPEHNPTRCSRVTRDAVVRALERHLVDARHRGRRAVVVGHHPLATRGEHGGFFNWSMHLFPLRMMEAYLPLPVEWLPLPGLGSLMVGVRSCCSPNDQDLAGPGNAAMRDSLLSALESAADASAPALLYAAGHDHSLQLFSGESGPLYLAVSGLGSSAKASAVGHDRRTLFAHANPDRPGFMRVDVLRDGAARLAVVEWDPRLEAGREVYALWLVGPLGAAEAAALRSEPASSASSRKRRPA